MQLRGAEASRKHQKVWVTQVNSGSHCNDVIWDRVAVCVWDHFASNQRCLNYKVPNRSLGYDAERRSQTAESFNSPIRPQKASAFRKIASKDTCDELNRVCQRISPARDPGEKRNKTKRSASFQMCGENKIAHQLLRRRGGLLFSRVFIQRALAEMTSVFLSKLLTRITTRRTHSPGFPIFHFFGRLMRS